MLKHRALTYGRELRAYQNELAKAAALHHRAASTRRGRIVFIAGQPKSGRTDLLVSLAHHLNQRKPAAQIIAGAFHSHTYYPATRDFMMTEVGAAVGETLAFAAKLIPSEAPAAAIDFVGQLLQAGAAAEAARAEAEAPCDYAEEIKRHLRHAPPQQPLIYLVDNLDHAGNLWLPWLLTDLATEIDRDLPLLVFVTLDAPAKLGEARDDEPIVWKAARELMQRGVAEWWPITPLTRIEVAAYIGNAPPNIADHLHRVTGGFPRRVVELWHDWQDRKVVWWSDKENCWQFDQTRHPSLNLVKDVIDDRLKNIFGADDHESLRQAREVLAYGALAGETFAADAVARALNWEDRDELIDFIDDELLHSEANPNGLLLEAESLPFTTEPDTTRPVWRYRFAHDLFWLANFQYGLTEYELPAASAALFNALQDVYGNQMRLIAGDLARLCRNGGAHDTAQHFQRMWDHSTARETMRQQGLLMAQVDKTGWSYWQKWVALSLLLEAAKLTIRSAGVEESKFILAESLRLAIDLNDQSMQVHSGYLLGVTHQMSCENEQAEAIFNDSLSISRKIGKRDGEAVCLAALGNLAGRRDDYAGAEALLTESLSISRESGRRDNQGASLAELAAVVARSGDYERAIMLYTESLSIRRELGNLDGEGFCLFGLAELAEGCGDYEPAETLYAESLSIRREIGNRDGERACLFGVAKMKALQGQREQAITLYEQSLVVADELMLGSEHVNVLETLAALAELRESAK